MKFTIPLTEEFETVGMGIPAERVFPYVPKEKEFLKERHKLTLLSVTVQTKKETGLLTIVRQCLMVLGELPILPLRAVMFNRITSDAEALVFELTSFMDVGEISL